MLKCNNKNSNLITDSAAREPNQADSNQSLHDSASDPRSQSPEQHNFTNPHNLQQKISDTNKTQSIRNINLGIYKTLTKLSPFSNGT